MELKESIEILKALGDKSRLRIVNSLFEKPQYVEEISERIGLSISTVSFHLKKLESANLVRKQKEQYYIVYKINHDFFNKTIKQLIEFENIEKEVQNERLLNYEQKVLNTFWIDGKIQKLPVQYKKKKIVLNQVFALFEKDKTYTEKEVDAIIKQYYDDYCTIRRFFIDEKMMRRNFGKYTALQEVPKQIAGRITKTKGKLLDKNEKDEIKREFKEKKGLIGVFQVKNKINGNVFVGKKKNLENNFNGLKFELKLGTSPFTKLQNDYNEFGEELFTFEILETIKNDFDGNINSELNKIYEKWMEIIKPNLN